MKWLLSTPVPSRTHFFGTTMDSRAPMCRGAQVFPCGFPLFPRAWTLLNHVPLSITNHPLSLKKKKKANSLELLQFTFFLWIHDFFWCLSTHHDLACLPRSCLGFGDVSSPHSLLQELPTSFGVQKILEQPKLARCQETRPLLSAQHLTHEPLRVSASWGRIPGRCLALE